MSTNHDSSSAPWHQSHAFHTADEAAERSTTLVFWITAFAMVAEIAAGYWFNSMALLADGWHMSSHALAIGLAVFAYATARRYKDDERFAFGTWKIEVLAGFTSAILLLVVAALMLFGSLERLLSPQAIHYREALFVAVLGLLVNLACAAILGRTGHGHDHGHDHGHHHGHDHHDHGHAHHDHGASDARAGDGEQHQDLNLRSAYVHVLADAATSVLAIAALAGGWVYGWWWLDPVMGIVGAVLVASWARGLTVKTGKVLLDREMDHAIVDEVREAVESAGDRVTDLHVWRVGRNCYACAITLLTSDAQLDAAAVRRRLAQHPEVAHSTIEIHAAPLRERA
ncbi:CDF family Co(II)/Ni(II) efflux transporter DmeF [Ramlibacter sp. MMS24-I3-19]|uniref:CDF family Co(II)/Ni(II) efflux transporter DmeF n=1 Tax=Ramlibacter sp. MMS24-I3-19 TaxID=3416606 RepID=UPI003D07B0E9